MFTVISIVKMGYLTKEILTGFDNYKVGNIVLELIDQSMKTVAERFLFVSIRHAIQVH